MVINISILPKGFIRKEDKQMTINTERLDKGIYYAFKYEKLHGFLKVNEDDSVNLKLLSWRQKLKFRKIFNQIKEESNI